MESRIYYLLGDLFSCALVSVVVAVLCAYIFSSAWPMPVLMLVSMVLGMFLALVLNIAGGLIYFFGAMEIMVPTMLVGMFAGMMGAMYGVEYGAQASSEEAMVLMPLIKQSAVLGVAVSIGVRIYSMLLSGKKQYV